MTEKELCAILKSILEKEWSVSGEVPCSSGYIDLVAWRNNPLYTKAYETKLSISTSGVAQAIKRTQDVNESWLVVMKKPSKEWKLICNKCGIGLGYILITDDPRLIIMNDASIVSDNHLNEQTLIDHLSVIGGGSPGEVTEWKIKCAMVWISLSEWKTLKELRAVNPYRSLNGLRDLIVNVYPFKLNVEIDKSGREHKYKINDYFPFPWETPLELAKQRLEKWRDKRYNDRPF